MLLLIEDDPLLGPLYVELLDEAGYQVTHTYHAKEIERNLTQHHYELVLLDVMLPGQSGLELLQKKQLWKDQKVVLMTNLDQEKVVRRARELGAAGCIIKSEHTPESFIQAVHQFLPAPLLLAQLT